MQEEPAAQSRQAAAPVAKLYAPAAHVVHELAEGAAYAPAGHAEQDVALADEYCPAAQAEANDKPDKAQYAPAEQSMHAEEALAG